MRSKLWWFPAILLLAGLATILVLSRLPDGPANSDDASPQSHPAPAARTS